MSEQRQNARARNRNVSVSFLVLALIAAIVLSFMGWQIYRVHVLAHQTHTLGISNRNLIIENQQRVSEIQASRVASCRKTYDVIRRLFTPFAKPRPGQTAQQRADSVKFFALITSQAKACAQQVEPERKPK